MASGTMQEIGVWRLGIHGARGAGKTCYLASLYGFRAEVNGTAVGFADEKTIEYLAEQWDDYLAKGKKPDATRGLPTDLHCQVKAMQRVWQISIRDYAGELIQRKSEGDVPELRAETREWLKACNAILFFLDITESEDSVRERLNELDLLLAELHRLSADGNTIARPLSLVLTKWDSRTDFDICHAESAAEREKAFGFLQSDADFGQFYAALKQSGDRVEVFPVSAFGSHRDGQLPPTDGPQHAFNIHAPLIWSVTKAEEMVAHKADRDAARFLGHGWPRYGAAIKELRRAVTRYRLNRGAAHDRLAKLIRDLEWKLWRRRGKVAAIVVVVAAITILGILFADEQGRYHGVLRAYDDPSIGSAGIKSLTDQYIARPNFFKGWSGHEADVRSRWAQRQATFAQRDFDNLEQFRRDHLTETDAASRVEKETAYLAVWEGGPHATTVAGWKMADADAAAKYQGRVTHESRYQGMLEDVAALIKANKYSEAAEAYRRFLRDFPESPYRADVETHIADMETAKDEYAWKQVVDFDQKNPNSFDETIKLAGQYLSSPGVKHRSHAEALVARTEDRWDWALYEQVSNASRGSADASTIESTQRKATAYLNGTQPRKRMKAEVQKWLDWFNALQTEADYNVVVRSIEIPAGSDLDESNPCCKVQISLNGRSYTTDWAYGKKPVYGAALGPYRFKWGQQGTFSVRIEEHDYDSPNDVAEFPRPDTDDRFILSRLNGPTAVRDRNGKAVMVYLECEAAKPPNLRAYSDK